jgi:hypothetical protein
MSKFTADPLKNSFQEKQNEMMLCMDQARALVNVASVARFSELDEATVFRYFIVLSDLIEEASDIASSRC